jgi:hypothetical protein
VSPRSKVAPRTTEDVIAAQRARLDELELLIAKERSRSDRLEKRVRAIELSLFGANAPTEEQLGPDDEDAEPIEDSGVDEGPHEDD